MRELLARVTSADIVEQKAYEQLEPYGTVHEEFEFGQVCALLANIHRKPGSKTLAGYDFMPALQEHLGKADAGEDILLEDDEAQSALIMATLFGRKPGA